MDFTYEPNRISLISDNNNLLAEVTFPDVDENIVNINHTYVHPDLRGQQVADTLMRLALGDIQKSGLTFTATCPYAVRWLERHPEHKP